MDYRYHVVVFLVPYNEVVVIPPGDPYVHEPGVVLSVAATANSPLALSEDIEGSIESFPTLGIVFSEKLKRLLRILPELECSHLPIIAHP